MVEKEEEEDSSIDDEFRMRVCGRWVPFSLRAVVEQELETLQVLFKNTENPVFLWKAILKGTIKFGAVIDAPDWDPWTATIPSWCVEHLQKFAYKVEQLGDGHLLTEGADDAPPIIDDLTPRQAANLIPELLGFKKKGWNAFNEYRCHVERHYVARYYYECMEGGEPPGAAMKKTLERYGYEDERSIRRLLAQYHGFFENKSQDQPDET